jgi:TetR/AcrR family transcriptional regulator, transcriptional repressor for nem operon
MNRITTRDRIVEAADDLFYRDGFEHTSFSNIAGVVGISRGNFYFHFRTKDEILTAVIGRRLEATQAMLDRWETEGADPADRIRSFIDILIANRVPIKRHGCPVGTLCTELAKLDHDAKVEARKLFTLFREWLRRQFEMLGCAQADMLAMHLLARSQGVATLAHAFYDEAFIREEVRLMLAWLDAQIAAALRPPRRAPRTRRSPNASDHGR